MNELNVPVLRPEKPVFLSSYKWDSCDLENLISEGWLRIVHVSNEFRDFCRQHQPYKRLYRGDRRVNVSTVKSPLSDDLLQAFRYWSGVPLQLYLSSLVLQLHGQTS